MDPLKLTCDTVIAELDGALRAGTPEQVSVSTAAHISGCAGCRGGLALLVSAMADATDDPGACAVCQDDLAAYVEQERADAVGAATSYPHVWRHLWRCPSCFADYLTTLEWLDAEQADLVAPLRLPANTVIERAIGVIRRIVLSRSVLALVLPPPPLALAPLRGSGGDGFVLFEDGGGPAQAQITISVSDSGDGTWELSVTTRPPIVGLLRLSAGATRMAAAFNGDGSATIGAIPFTLLSDQNSPDLELIVLPVRDANQA